MRSAPSVSPACACTCKWAAPPTCRPGWLPHPPCFDTSEEPSASDNGVLGQCCHRHSTEYYYTLSSTVWCPTPIMCISICLHICIYVRVYTPCVYMDMHTYNPFKASEMYPVMKIHQKKLLLGAWEGETVSDKSNERQRSWAVPSWIFIRRKLDWGGIAGTWSDTPMGMWAFQAET